MTISCPFLPAYIISGKGFNFSWPLKFNGFCYFLPSSSNAEKENKAKIKARDETMQIQADIVLNAHFLPKRPSTWRAWKLKYRSIHRYTRYTTFLSVALLKDLRHYKWNVSARRDRKPGSPKDVFSWQKSWHTKNLTLLEHFYTFFFFHPIVDHIKQNKHKNYRLEKNLQTLFQ